MGGGEDDAVTGHLHVLLQVDDVPHLGGLSPTHVLDTDLDFHACGSCCGLTHDHRDLQGVGSIVFFVPVYNTGSIIGLFLNTQSILDKHTNHLVMCFPWSQFDWQGHLEFNYLVIF